MESGFEVAVMIRPDQTVKSVLLPCDKDMIVAARISRTCNLSGMTFPSEITFAPNELSFSIFEQRT